MLREGEGIIHFSLQDRGRVRWGLVEGEGEGEGSSTWHCLWGEYEGRGTCFGQRGWGKEVVGFVLALMRVLGAWISVVLGFRPYFG